jgi:hypothetical protein
MGAKDLIMHSNMASLDVHCANDGLLMAVAVLPKMSQTL